MVGQTYMQPNLHYLNFDYLNTYQDPKSLFCFPMHAGVPTTMNLNDTVTVQEGDSINIACVSSGNPIPTISWYLGSSPAPFSLSNTVIDLEAGISREIPGDQSTPTVLRFSEGNITSVLQITNAVYPAHDGEYTCVGLNSHNEVDNTSNATITVQVQGICDLLHIELYAAALTILSDQKIMLFKEAYHC